MPAPLSLVKALRLQPEGLRLALVGAGGKSTALFHLGRSLPSPVWLAASTHLSLDQAALADRHIIVQAEGDLETFPESPAVALTLFTGPAGADGRTAGLEAGSLKRLHRLAARRGLPLLVEADGARRRPLKAPAAHEPVIPAFSQTVVVVAGLSGLGKPLDESHIHRPEQFGALTGLPPGSAVTVEALAALLAHPEGGLRGIPPEARRVLLLNQADTAELQAAANQLAGRLQGRYHAVVVASLQPRGAVGAAPRLYAVHEPVGAVLLAAGRSERFGSPKQLLDWKGESFVRAIARTALAAGLSPVGVVSGAYTPELRLAIRGLPVMLVHNPDWEQGQSSSVRAGLLHLPGHTAAAVFLLCDQPQISESLLRGLVDLHAQTLSPIVAPLAGGQRANPVLFDRALFPDLMALEGDTGGRALFSRHAPAWLPWHDPALLLDVDTLEDYRRLLEAAG